MSGIVDFKKRLAEIDRALNLIKRESEIQNRLLDVELKLSEKQYQSLIRVIHIATDALLIYPCNFQLIKRRAFARCLIAAFSERKDDITSAESDLKLIYEIEPNNLEVGSELLNLLFGFYKKDNMEVAQTAEHLVVAAEKLLIKYVTLQISALKRAFEYSKAEEVYDHWKKFFPRSKVPSFTHEEISCLSS